MKQREEEYKVSIEIALEDLLCRLSMEKILAFQTYLSYLSKRPKG